jgi:uncharacterized protein YbcI
MVEISNAMVRLYMEAFGRGPTGVESTLAGPDTLLVMLLDAFTVAERTLLSLGEIDRLRDSRLAIQHALEEPARSLVERALGRETVAFLTGVDPTRGIAINVFTMKPSQVVGGHRDGTAHASRREG